MVVDPLLCSGEELLVLLVDQAVVIEGLQTQVAGQRVVIENLQALVVELRRRLDADSSNSSRRPSSDSPFKRPPPKGSGMPADDGPARKQGKQRGAVGKNRRQVDNPDERSWWSRARVRAAVAAWFGITQAQLSRIENGPPVVHLDRLNAWANILGVPPALLWFQPPDRVAPQAVHEPGVVFTWGRSTRAPGRVAGLVRYATCPPARVGR